MGSNDGDARDDEKPVHLVYLDAFYMDKYEVTVHQYKRFVQETGHRAPDWNNIATYSPTDQHPIIYVNWYDAMAYAQWAGKRLPTEAEWEKAARGRLVGKRYPSGDSINTSKANYAGKVGGTKIVGGYAANGYGLYDMAGNVSEWCLDAYNSASYGSLPQRNPVSGGSIVGIINNFANVNNPRVLRGGTWHSSARSVRCARRYYNMPTNADYYIGFRCVRNEKNNAAYHK